jgi:hypothetical protein
MNLNINYWSDFLYLLDNEDKMEVEWDSTPAISISRKPMIKFRGKYDTTFSLNSVIWDKIII